MADPDVILTAAGMACCGDEREPSPPIVEQARHEMRLRYQDPDRLATLREIDQSIGRLLLKVAAITAALFVGGGLLLRVLS